MDRALKQLRLGGMAAVLETLFNLRIGLPSVATERITEFLPESARALILRLLLLVWLLLLTQKIYFFVNGFMSQNCLCGWDEAFSVTVAEVAEFVKHGAA